MFIDYYTILRQKRLIYWCCVKAEERHLAPEVGVAWQAFLMGVIPKLGSEG